MKRIDREPTPFSMLLYRLGWVRRKHYDQLGDQYARLVSKYIEMREGVDRLLKDVDTQKRRQMQASASDWREGGAV